MSIVVTIDERDSNQSEREALYGNGAVGKALDELAFALRPQVKLRVISRETDDDEINANDSSDT